MRRRPPGCWVLAPGAAAALQTAKLGVKNSCEENPERDGELRNPATPC